MFRQQQKLKELIDKSASRLDVIEQQQKVDDKIEKLNNRDRDLSNKVSELKGLISAVSFVFLLMTFLGLGKIYQYEKLEASSQEINKLLIKQIEAQTADAIDKLNVTEVSDEQKRRIIELDENIESLLEIKVSSKRFKGIIEIVEVLKKLVLEQDEEEALKKVSKLPDKYLDHFVRSRALTLRSVMRIALNRSYPPDEVKKDLLEAIRLDSSNAGAFNGLGIRTVSEAVGELNKDEFEHAKDLMKKATENFKMAAALNPSSSGTYKSLNNKTWGSLLLFRAFLLKGGTESEDLRDLLRSLNYIDAETFFDESRKELRAFEYIAPTIPAALETIAQSMFLEAEYKRTTNQNTNSLKDGAMIFAEAINHGLYRKVPSETEAIEQFNKDYLHEYFIQQEPGLATDLRDKIKDWYKRNKR